MKAGLALACVSTGQLLISTLSGLTSQIMHRMALRWAQEPFDMAATSLLCEWEWSHHDTDSEGYTSHNFHSCYRSLANNIPLTLYPDSFVGLTNVEEL